MKIFEVIKPVKHEGEVMRDSNKHTYYTKLGNKVDVYFSVGGRYDDNLNISFKVNDEYQSTASTSKGVDVDVSKDKEILAGVLYEILYYVDNNRNIKKCEFSAYSDKGDKKTKYNLPLAPRVKSVQKLLSELLNLPEAAMSISDSDKEVLNNYLGLSTEDAVAQQEKLERIISIYRVNWMFDEIGTELHDNIVDLHQAIESHGPDGAVITRNRRKDLYTAMVKTYFADKWNIRIVGNSFELTRLNRLSVIPEDERDLATCIELFNDDPSKETLVAIPKKFWDKEGIINIIVDNSLIDYDTIDSAPDAIQIEILKNKPGWIKYIKNASEEVLFSVDARHFIEYINAKGIGRISKKVVADRLLQVVSESAKTLFDIDKKYRTRAMYEAAAPNLEFYDWYDALARKRILFSHIPEEILTKEYLLGFSVALGFKIEEIPKKFQFSELWFHSIKSGNRSIKDVPERFVNELLPTYPILAFRLANPTKQQISAAEQFIIDHPEQLKKNEFLKDKLSDQFKIGLIQNDSYKSSGFFIENETSEKVISAFIRNNYNLRIYGGLFHKFTPKLAELMVSIHPQSFRLLASSRPDLMTPTLEKKAIDSVYKNSEYISQFTEISGAIQTEQGKNYYKKLMNDFIMKNALSGNSIGFASVDDRLFNKIFDEFMNQPYSLQHLGRFMMGFERLITDAHIKKIKQAIVNNPSLINTFPPSIKQKFTIGAEDYNDQFYNLVNQLKQGHTYGSTTDLINFVKHATLNDSQIATLKKLVDVTPGLLEKLPVEIGQKISGFGVPNEDMGSVVPNNTVTESINVELNRIIALTERLNR